MEEWSPQTSCSGPPNAAVDEVAHALESPTRSAASRLVAIKQIADGCSLDGVMPRPTGQAPGVQRTSISALPTKSRISDLSTAALVLRYFNRGMRQGLDSLHVRLGSEEAVTAAAARVAQRHDWDEKWSNFEVTGADALPTLGRVGAAAVSTPRTSTSALQLSSSCLS